MAKTILVLSYYTNIPGACQAEWVDDRMFAFIEKGYSISLVSATCCFTHTRPEIEHYKVPTLSPHGATYEYNERIRNKIPVKKGILFAYTWLMPKIDRVLQAIHLRSGEGRWTWFISAFLTALYRVNNKKDIAFVYSTGGPPSAHIAAILFARIYGKKIICEFQDPLSGDDIGRHKLSRIGLKFFEKIIIRYATITIYCTRNAMLYARKQYPGYAQKIDYVYPGSNAVEHYQQSDRNIPGKSGNRKINITYLGSLYQTRNLDTTMQALSELIESGKSPAIEINIYGVMNTDIRERIVNFPHPGFIFLHNLVTREMAMQKALEADVLLLIQHKDKRSIPTMPFKIYDYLHTGNLIFGLIYRNDEIEEILVSHGHLVCQADDVEGIKEKLLLISGSFNNLPQNIRKSDLTPEKAVERILQLLNQM